MLGFGHSIQDAEAILAQPRIAIIFPHIHKTAGSTIELAIRKNFGLPCVPSRTLPERDNIKNLISTGFFDADARYIVFGHVTEGVADLLKPIIPVTHFTFMRDPIKRMESFYAYQRIRQGITDTPRQFIDRFIPNRTIYKHIEADSARHALDVFKRSYFMVGLTENFPQHFGVLCKLLRVPAIARETITVMRPEDKITLSPEDAEHYKQRNEEECALYDSVATTMKTIETELSEYAAPAELTVGDKSYVNATRINANLNKNNDHVSLFLTGKHLWDTNPKRAKAFFDKCVAINPVMSREVANFVRQATPLTDPG